MKERGRDRQRVKQKVRMKMKAMCKELTYLGVTPPSVVVKSKEHRSSGRFVARSTNCKAGRMMVSPPDLALTPVHC